jgi:hypothetical protein
LLSLFSPDPSLALQRYIQCTEHENWTPQVGFATIIDRKEETEERLTFLLDRLLGMKLILRQQILLKRKLEHASKG